jgi:penicillin-binding protein 1A
MGSGNQQGKRMTSKARSKQHGNDKRRRTARLEGAVRSATDMTPRQRAKRTALKVLKWGSIAGLAGAALGVSLLAVIFWLYGRDPNLPNITSLNDYRPKQVTRIAAGDDTVVGEIFSERRTYVPYEKVPKLVVQAFISAEDSNFFEHGGLDYWGMLRALIVNVRAGKKKQGASTITQQVVKTFLLSPERSLRRKVQEIILARRLEQALAKEEILSLYLNQIYFGHGRYGVHEAARFYFGKDVSELDAGEAALLGGLPQSPENISPRKPENQPRAKRRQQYVLEQMAHHGYISEAEAQKFIDAPIAIIREPFPDLGAAPEWIEVVRQELIRRYGEEAIDTLGATVHTTLDMKVQRAAQAALREGLREYDKRQKYGRPVRSTKPDKIDLEVSKLQRKLPKGGPKPGANYLAVVRTVHDADNELVVDLGRWLGSVILGGPADERFEPADPKTGKRKPASERFAAGDIIRVRLSRSGPGDNQTAKPKHSEHLLELATGAEGAVVVMDPKTRHVLAMVGGYATRIGDFNRAVQAKRQPGSSFKPIVYAAALDSGAYTAASVVNDAPEVYDLWKPQNYKKGTFEGPVRLRYALAKSINTVAIRVLHDVGIDRVVGLARDMGIESELPESLSLALGSGEVTPLEMTNAIATLAAGGRAQAPVFIRAIDDAPIEAQASREVLTEEIAYVIVDMMTSVVQEGTARAAKKLGIPVAGKTGTSNEARDAWFLGITPSYVVGVWIGFDDNQSLGNKEAGGKTALPVFMALMEAIGKNERRKDFARPSSIERVRIDKQTGLLAPDNAPPERAYMEVFAEGSAPTETALAPDEVSTQTLIESEYDDEYENDPDQLEGGSDQPDDDSHEQRP